MKTQKQYWETPFEFEGEAKIVDVTKYKEASAITVDVSLFYPEGGGQKGDRGKIVCGNETYQVVDTQVDDEGAIFLILDRICLVTIGSTVVYHVNEDWRRRQMSQHTGQHLLSRMLDDRYHAPTVSARLGETNFSLEVNSQTLTQTDVVAAEDALNKLILEDRPIRTWFPTPEELSTLDLRKQPTVTEGIRVVQVEGFDVTPCGGTHCTRTGQVGVVHIQSIEKFKGLTRLYVSVGLDAAREFQRKDETLRSIQSLVDANEESVVKQVEALKNQCRQAIEDKGRYMGCAAEAEAKQRLAAMRATSIGSFTAPVLVHLQETSIEYARLLSKALAREGKVVSIVSFVVEGGMMVMVDRGGEAVGGNTPDVGAVLKKVLAQHEGKGGGSALHAEGRIANDKEQIFLNDLVAALTGV